MPLTYDEKKHLRAIGHDLKPIVTVASKGVIDTVVAEIDRALNDHELIKVKFQITDRQSKQAAIEHVCKSTGAVLIQRIGHVALLLRKAEKPKARLSNLSKKA